MSEQNPWLPPGVEIVRKKFDIPHVDVMDGDARREVQIDEHGLVALVDVMPRLVPAERLTADFAIAQAARTSTGTGLKGLEEDRGLVRYLYRHTHTTPSEMVEFKFHHVLPIFVARQLIRHRTANVNEFSARYAVMKDRFWIPKPEVLRGQSTTGSKQHTEGQVEEISAETFLARLEDHCDEAYADYQKALAGGMGRELARIGLPLNIYTEWYWKLDAHNLFHFLKLRMDKHAQKEIRDYANAMFALIQPILPDAAQAFLDYRLNAMTLSALEIEAIRTGKPLASDNKREQEEWRVKKERLNLFSANEM